MEKTFISKESMDVIEDELGLKVDDKACIILRPDVHEVCLLAKDNENETYYFNRKFEWDSFTDNFDSYVSSCNFEHHGKDTERTEALWSKVFYLSNPHYNRGENYTEGSEALKYALGELWCEFQIGEEKLKKYPDTVRVFANNDEFEKHLNEFATNHAKVYVTSKMHIYPEDIEKQIKDETLPEILNVLDVHTKKNVSEVNKCSSVKSIQEMIGVMRYFENFLDADLSFSKNTDEFFKIAEKLNRKNSYYKNDMFMETDRVSPTEREKGLKMEQNFTAFVKDLQKTTEIYWERIKDDVFSMNNAEFMYRYGGSKKDGVIRDRKAAIFTRSLTNAAYLYANEYAKEINKRIEKLSQVFLAERKPSDRHYVKEDFKNLDIKDVQKLFKDNHFFLVREYYDGNNIKWEDIDGTKPNNLSSQILVYDLDKNNEVFSPAALFESKYFNSYLNRTEHFADVLQKFYEHGKQWETNKESVMKKWEEAFKRDNYDKHPEVFHWGPYGEAHNKAELIKIYSEEYDNHLKICKGLEKMIERKKAINLTPDFKEGQGNGLKK